MKFAPMYGKGKIKGTKVYQAFLTTPRDTRISKRPPFKTATAALDYARRWAERANR